MKTLIIIFAFIGFIGLPSSCKKGDKGDTGPAGSAGSNTPGAGYVHYIGESYNGGIVFHVYRGSDNLEHGLIVSLTQNPSVAWQTTASLVNANRTWDGAYNTALMINSPAATYVATLGTGWYIPSVDELNKLYYNRFEVNKALNAGGNTLLSTTGSYWSSTEFDATSAFGCADGGSSVVRGKGSLDKARAIRSF
jgi:hypothetical protein